MEHAGVAPFRIGATSYVIPGDLVTNARHLADRDHGSLAHLSAHQLDPVLEVLLAHGFQGVVTLEVFEADFAPSVRVLYAALARITAKQNALVQRGDS